MSMNWLEAMTGHPGEPARRPCPSSPGRSWWSPAAAAGWAARPPPTWWRPAAAPSSSAMTRAKSTTPSRPWPRTAAYGITADLTNRSQVDRVCRQLADEHADATLLVNAAGLFIPKPFLDHD